MSDTFTDVNMTISINNGLINENYYALDVSKFFFMLFPKADGRTLHIYTALAFSLFEYTHALENTDTPHKSSSYVELKIGFEGQVSVDFYDLTDSLINQSHLLTQIWDDIRANGESKEVTFKDKDKNIDVLAGEFDPAPSEGYYIVSTTDKKKSVITWVKSTVVLPISFIGRDFRVRVKFDLGSGNVQFICPDYMWYVCTPPDLNHKVSSGLISFDNGKTIRPNQISILSKDTPLKLIEWVENEDILECKRARLKFDGQKNPHFENKKDLLVVLKIEELFEEHSNRQFFTGLLIAFFSAFVADYTRISSMLMWQFDTAPVIRIHLLSMLFPISIIISYITYVVPISRIVDMLEIKKGRKILSIIKRLGIILSLMGPTLFYIINPVIKTLNNTIPLPKVIVMISFSIVGCILSGIYCFGFAKRAHIKFYNYL